MRIVMVHERYQQPGGEDAAFDADLALLQRKGHDVAVYERHNDDIAGLGALGRARVAAGTVWSPTSVRGVGRLLDAHRPDVMHVHNTFPLLSPAIYRAATRRGIPVVQTVQNYRMICAAYMCLRDGHLCHDCVGRALPLPAIRYRCYHESAAQSAVVGAMQVAHRNLGTWDHHCALFLPCSAHVGRRLVAAGAIRDDRWMPRFNHVWPDPGLRADGSDEGYVAFAGRLSEEKGVDVLVRAAAGAPEVDVRIAGDGPVLDEMKRLAGAVGATNVTFLGRLARPDVLPFLRGARCLAFPSIWEEPQGLVIAEAAALGVATIGSDIGGVPEVIGPGMLVPAADEVAWASALRDAAADAEGWRRRGLDSRRVFERDFNAERAYDVLLEAYARIGVRP